MTADDVVYSYEQAKKNEYINNVYLNSIASIVAINPQQIEIKTSQPDPVLLNKLTFLMIIDAKGNGEVSPVYGTGAFTLKKGTKPSEDKIELVAFDDYHGGRVQTRELTLIRTDSDEQSTDLLLKGKGNIAGDFLPSNIPALDKKKMYRIPYTSYSTTFLAPVTNKPGPLQKQEVRKALQYSLDVPKIIEATGLSAKQSSQLVTSLIPGYNPAIPEVSQDIEKAKQLLSEAGYPNGVTLDFIYSPAAPSELIKEVIRQSALAGITLKGREVEGLEEMRDPNWYPQDTY
jgi:peptide/nickel transport system substrate-binding protein